MKRRRIWGTAAAVVAGLSGVLVFQGVTGNADGAATGGDRPAPVQADVRSTALKADGARRTAVLDQRDTEPFSMLGVTWKDPSARVTGGKVEARTRDAGSGRWSEWLTLDADSGQGEAGAERGGTEPAWVGPSDGVEVRVTAGGSTSGRLPDGLQLDMIDPGEGGTTTAMAPAAFAVEEFETGSPEPSAAPGTAEPDASEPAEPTASTDPAVEPTPSAPATKSPTPGGPAPWSTSPSASPSTTSPAPSPSTTPGPPSTMPQPPITSRAGWGADESISPEEPSYLPGGKVKAVVVHHTAESNTYTCADAPRMVRGIYAYHVQRLGWKDIGYNFLVDKCGTVYEGRKGGVDRPVQGAHAYGFNAETTGISVLGTYTEAAPSTAAMTSVARIAAWKLGQYGVDPTGTTTLTAGASGSNYFHKSWASGAKLTFPTIHGHRDGYNTQCPGNAFYDRLSTLRAWAGGPVQGLAVTSLAGGGTADGTLYVKSAVAVNWKATTPASLVSRYEVLVDGAVAATAGPTATYAKATLAAGAHQVQVRAVHLSGRTTVTPARAVVADTAVPAFSTAPYLALRTGTVSTSSVPVALGWKATDNGALRDVRLTAPLTRTYGPTVTYAAHTAKPGTATAWSMTAYDQAGNSQAASVTGTPVLLPETSAVKYGAWATKSSSSHLGGAALASGAKNASLTWTFTGRSVAWVVSRTAASGQAYVYVDGVKAATVDLKSSTTLYRQAIWKKSWSTSAKHTVKIVVVGTTGRPTVTTDGLVYLK
ncbi:N-acetylmuramoyl-L-alanine amidase [Streptomyces sp. NPDC047928]|uniref:N-acetylmuramoyl-L-alanine amidase n=1 Tax=unclassified Streptomyces TaxID=2593676 RepID=UPI0037116664